MNILKNIMNLGGLIMIKINFEKEGSINNRELAFITLANSCGKVLANRSLYPEDINEIADRYLFTGCKSRHEYEYLVNFLIDNLSIRKELLK